MNFKELVNRISGIYDEREASSIAKMLLEESFGLSFVDVCLGALDRLSDEEKESLEARLSNWKRVSLCSMSLVMRISMDESLP